jgi:hypothetical protein
MFAKKKRECPKFAQTCPRFMSSPTMQEQATHAYDEGHEPRAPLQRINSSSRSAQAGANNLFQGRGAYVTSLPECNPEGTVAISIELVSILRSYQGISTTSILTERA